MGPTVPHDSGDAGAADVGLRNMIIEGVNGFDFVQTNAENPVVNPPFNNWSVNQPTVPHDSGLAGNADLGQNIIVDGHPVHFAQADKPTTLAQIIPLTTSQNQPGNFAIADKNYEN